MSLEFRAREKFADRREIGAGTGLRQSDPLGLSLKTETLQPTHEDVDVDRQRLGHGVGPIMPTHPPPP
ncbi:hypothetical protein Hjap01_03771 [Haloarcula japonica]|uniref:Uncharacterized protein n=1 Tax=Haloarcula sebkhae TaxID=932660 RepID=A0A830EVU7_9EURY|nr:hypothetical protein GCM10009067_35220 [Haloarcula sebkhae]